MPEPQYLTTPDNRQIAYHFTQGDGPTIVFLGGFKSDMEGTKAVHLESWSQAQGRAFLRLDYSGHGQSSGAFLDGCIGDWAQDARHVISEVAAGPLVLVGSSMGGWIALILAKSMRTNLAGLVTIAAAPDFTEDSMLANFTEAQKKALDVDGQVALPSDYSEEPYIITKKLIENGRDMLVLRDPLALNIPVRFLQGTEDTDVPVSVALRVLEHVDGDDIRLTLVKGADHRFSDASCLAVIERALAEVLANAKVG